MRNAHNPQVYIPQPEYSNGDFLVYSVFDGVQESAEARFDFKFFAKDNLPIATAVAARVDEDSALGVRIQLNGSDVDSADPTFVIPELPQKGKLFTIDGEPIEAAHLNPPEVAGGLPDLAQALLQGEGRRLVGIPQHASLNQYTIN